MDVALDVERYGEFVPYCESCSIRENSVRKGKQVMLAAMSVGVSIFNETFVSRVIADRENGTIKVTGLDGPLNALVNTWHITPTVEGSLVDFEVSFEFKSRILATLASSRVEGVCEKILNAFIARAHSLYCDDQETA